MKTEIPAANFTGLVLGCIETGSATKYSLESSRRDLQNALLCTALHFHFFPKIAKIVANFYRDFTTQYVLPKFCNIFTKFRWNFAVICPEKMHQRPGVPGSFPGVFQDLQLSEIAPNLQFPELANNCARPAAALRDVDDAVFLGFVELLGPETSSV